MYFITKLCRGRRNQGLGRVLAAWVAAQGADIQEPAAPPAAEVQRATRRWRTDERRKKRGSPHARRRKLQQQLPRGPVAAATARRQGRHVRRLPPSGARPHGDAGAAGEEEEAGDAAPVREAAGGLQGRVQPARAPAGLPQEAEGPGGGEAEAADAPAEQSAEQPRQPEGRFHGRWKRGDAPVHGWRQPAGAEPAGWFPADETRAHVQPQLLR